MPYNKTLGKIGEDIAEEYLLTQGYEVVNRNWSFKKWELDLVVKKDDEWRFIEVKTRSSIKYGYPEEAVDDLKIENLYLAIDAFLRENDLKIDNFHLDIIAIILNDKDFDVRWLKDAV